MDSHSKKAVDQDLGVEVMIEERRVIWSISWAWIRRMLGSLADHAILGFFSLVVEIFSMAAAYGIVTS